LCSGVSWSGLRTAKRSAACVSETKARAANAAAAKRVMSPPLGRSMVVRREEVMATRTAWLAGLAALSVVFSAHAQKASIKGTVTGPNGPEAGVWVIAGTADLPTGYAKIVVTDDKGSFVIPQLPKASYDVWVRGYGLTDSEKTKASPGKNLKFTVKTASEKEAAEHYPGMYWYSLINIPGKDQFP